MSGGGKIKHATTKIFGSINSDITKITQDIYAKNLELAQTNRTLSLLRNIDILVLEPKIVFKELCDSICKQVSDSTGYTFCGLLIADPEDRHLHLAGSSFAVQKNYKRGDINQKSALILGDDVEVIQKNVVINGGDSHLVNAMSEYVRDALAGHTFETVVVARMSSKDNYLGFLILGRIPGQLDLSASDKIEIDRISGAVGIALENRLLYEENVRILKKLETSNKKLQALDEAKDEFISMASHQLRTPLTSVKGYLSMVLEGDVGKVSADQRQMLETAYTSSQRMVYLISDLLNVSRIQTGKFVIEPKDVYLPDVVADELKQIAETAKAKKISINYQKPNSFATVQLDETKIRQVIMNFADNAVYYTPVNGEITVELIEKDSSVEFLVHDNGIGVPKADQHKLFAKFFRAGNARKARPDGTGLGLFMAQKVIIASGGAIVFKSKEGQGSTFGFTVPK